MMPDLSDKVSDRDGIPQDVWDASDATADFIATGLAAAILGKATSEDVAVSITKAVSNAIMADRRTRPAASTMEVWRPTFEEARDRAVAAVRALDDWTNVNETEFTGWGDGDVPPIAEWWRIKSGQALKALEELFPPAAPIPPEVMKCGLMYQTHHGVLVGAVM